MLAFTSIPSFADDFKPTADDVKFLNLVERKAFDFFWEQADPKTGLIKDQSNNWKEDTEKEAHKKYRASIASVGFGLSALVVGVERGWITPEQGYKRALTTIDTFEHKLFRDNRGLYYHWIDMRTNGQWMWEGNNGSEISTIDTALFMTGAITAGEYFAAKHGKPAVKEGAERIYRGIKWNAFGDQLTNYYNEYIIITLLGLGSPDYPVNPDAWNKMWRNFQYSTANRKGEANFPRIFYPSLFIHLFPACWFDFRDKHDQFADYFVSARNSVLANRQYCIDHAVGGLADRQYQYTTYGPDSWGLSASEIPPPRGYDHYGEAEPALDDTPASGMRGIAGNVAIHAAGGSMPFTPKESLSMMRHLYSKYKDDLWGKYGFCDAFNTDPREKAHFNNKAKTMWRADIVSGLDQGVQLLMIENYRTGLIWKYFMMNEFVKKGMERAGFVPMPKLAGGGILDLAGGWAFNTGDNPQWKDPAYDDSQWKKIRVPAKWEDEGYIGYDGTAWYRTRFKTPEFATKGTGRLVVSIGAVDDADETYLNGTKIGGLGRFEPEKKTAWDRRRIYIVPGELLNASGDNVLAVRVGDFGGGGGIYKGPVQFAEFDALQYKPFVLEPTKDWNRLVDLAGQWMLATGDADPAKMDSKAGWKQVRVPSAWETQGFTGYDGIAVYRKDFTLDKDLEDSVKDETVVLKIGAVDDADATYINGVKVGGMGDFPPGKDSAWDRERRYEFPKKLLKFGGTNVITIRVNDNMLEGGITKGPVEILY